jgi:hypothetical protein
VGKYSSVTSDGVLVGFQDDSFNYFIYNQGTRKVILSHNVTFCEDSFPFPKENPNPSPVEFISDLP